MNSFVWACIKLAFVGAVLLLGGILYYNVSTKDVLEFRSKLISLYLERKLSDFFSGADIKMHGVKLTWRREDENFCLSAKGLQVVDKNMGIKVEAPEVSVYSKIGILFLWGDWGDSRLEIPSVSVDFLAYDEAPGKLLQVPITTEVVRSKLSELIKYSVPVRIKELLFRDKQGSNVMLGSLNFGTESKYDGRVFSLEFISEESSVKVHLSEHYKGILSMRVKYNNLRTNLLKYLEHLDSKIAQYSDLVISGTADMVFDANDRIEYGDINLHNLAGSIPCGKDRELNVQKFRARARFSDGRLRINNFHLFANDIALRMSASFDSTNGHLDVNIGGYEIGVQNVCTYWPEHLHTNVRSWYCTYVRSGFFREPQISFHGHISDIDRLENYIVSSHLKDAVVLIDDELGEVRIVDGGLLLNKGDLMIRSGNYNYRGIHAEEGIALIKNSSDSAAKLEVQGKAISSAETLYKAAGVNDNLGVGGENVSGIASTKFAIEVSNIANSNPSHSKVSISSNIKGFGADGILGSFNVRDTQLDVVYDDGNLRIDADGKMNDKVMIFHAIKDHERNGDTRCTFSGYISGEDLQRLSLAGRALEVGGLFESKITWVRDSRTEVSNIRGKLDISDLSLGNGEGYFDLGKKRRSLLFSASVHPNGDIDVKDTAIIGDDSDIRLKGKISEEKVIFTVDKLGFLKTNARALVEYVGNNLNIEVKGEFLDFSTANLGTFLQGKSSTLSSNVRIQGVKALMRNGVELEQLDFSFTSDGNGATSANVLGYFAGDKALIGINYGPIGLEVETENAGRFLRAIDVLNTVDGGRLSIYMYPENHKGRTNGVFSITRFNIVNAPILAQILTLSSLKGIGNTLSGSGIHFSKLNVPFSYSNNIIKFAESWMEGAELGISLGGQIDLIRHNFDLRGQVVPAYAVNKMVWNTPIVGKLLTGGYSRGIVAIDYKVKGTAKVHDISVNLLSILTPNLLKRVLKVLDYKMKQEAGIGMQDAEDDAA